MMPYGERWRARPRLCHEALNLGTTENSTSYQYRYAYRFLSRLLEEPESFMQETDL